MSLFTRVGWRSGLLARIVASFAALFAFGGQATARLPTDANSTQLAPEQLSVPDRINIIRKRIADDKNSSKGQPSPDKGGGVTQFLNFPNFPNFQNFPNFPSFPNFPRYGRMAG